MYMHLFHTADEFVQALLALAAAYNLSNTRSQDIHGCYRFAIFILAHVECLDTFGVVGYNHRLFEMLFYKVTFMLALHVYAPFYLVLKLLLFVCGRLQ